VTSDGLPTSEPVLDDAQRTRAVGSVVAAAAGDALGAPYEFQAPLPASEDVDMIGGGVLGWGVGEWTDDTAMAIVVLEGAAAAAGNHDLRTESALDQIAREWFSWSMGTPDIGALTSTVMRRASDRAQQRGHSMPRIAGNGALMRTHAVVLPYLTSADDDLHEALVEVCRLTHVHEDVVEACLLWGFAVRNAILTGEVDVRCGLGRLTPERAQVWTARIEEAERSAPVDFRRNGWVVHAFQGAWSAVHGIGDIPEGKFAQREALVAAVESAVRAGYDTDTVACITGSLMGAALGYKAVPPEWRRELFGWPSYDVTELMGLAERVITTGGDRRR
jgi:ADP-ribosylglycohydrolase